MLTARRMSLCCALAGAILLAACGGSSEEGGDEGFETQAAELCSDAAVEQVELSLAGRTGEETDAAAQAEQLQGSAEDFAERFEALEAPAEQAETWAAYVETRRRAADLVAAQAEALAEEEDAAANEAVTELNATLSERDELGAELGIDVCARVLPEADVAEIERAVELGAVSSDGEMVCNEVVSSVLIEEGFAGSVERCIEAQSQGPHSRSVTFERVYGVEGVLATVEAELEDGIRDGGPVLVQLIPEDGSWRVLEIAPSN
jgi:hypothetical protein